jgi:hypothetical protein
MQGIVMQAGAYRVADEALHLELSETSVWLHVAESGDVRIELLLSEDFSLTADDGSCGISCYTVGFDEVIARSIHSSDDLPSMLTSLQYACDHVEKAIQKKQSRDMASYHGDGI